MLYVLCLVLVLAWNAVAQAATFFVDAARPNDSGSGTTLGLAKRTLGAGLALLSAGDTLQLATGVYTDTQISTNIPNGGNASTPTTVMPVPGHTATIRPASCPNAAIFFSGSHAYVTFKGPGLILDGQSCSPTVNPPTYGIYLKDDTHDVTVEQMEIVNFAGVGVALQAPSYNCRIRANWIHHVGLYTGLGDSGFAGYYGIYLQGTAHIIEDNTIEDVVSGWGFHASAGGNPVDQNIVRRNWIHTTNTANSNVNGAGGFLFWSYVGGNNQIYQNVISANRATQAIVFLEGGNAGNTFVNNTIASNVGSSGNAIRFGGEAAWLVRNNIVYGNTSNTFSFDAGGVGSNVISHNLQTSPNPLFVDATGDDFQDFQLSGTSPAIDAGVNVGLPFNGVNPDQGAFESGGTLVTPTQGTFYISTPGGSPAGSDTNDCDAAKVSSTPKATFASVFPCMAAGSTLRIYLGTYVQSIDSASMPVLGGTDFGTALTITSWPTAGAILRPAAAGGTVVSLTQADNHHIILSGLVLDGASTSAVGIEVGGAAHHVRVTGNTLHHFQGSALWANGTASNEFLSNTIATNAGTTAPFYAILLSNGAATNLVELNTVTTFGEACIASRSFGGPANSTNRLSRNICSGGTDTGEAAIMIGEGGGDLVSNNLVHHSGGGIRVAPGITSAFVYHNTLADNTTGAGFGIFIDSTATNINAQNNIVYGNTQGIVDNSPGAPAGVVTSPNFTTNPLFLNPAGGIYRLDGTSGAIVPGGANLLATVPNDLLGTARTTTPTHGAYQEVAATVPTVPLVGLPYGRTGLFLLP